MAPEAVAKAAFYDPAGPIAVQLSALPEDPEAQLEAQVQLTWTLGCVGKFIWPIPEKGLKKRLHRLQAPTLLVWGRHDGLVPPVYAQEFANRIANARVELIDRAAHMPHLEQLTTVSALMHAFLTP
jgi:pimeloyl-ACP methyl ester carboxylesterase